MPSLSTGGGLLAYPGSQRPGLRALPREGRLVATGAWRRTVLGEDGRDETVLGGTYGAGRAGDPWAVARPQPAPARRGPGGGRRRRRACRCLSGRGSAGL